MKKLINKIEYILLSVYVVVLSFFCVGTSPILDYMDPDSHLFRILGRAMANGQIAYVDVFDHKGPYIYFIEYLGALISPHSEWGLFLLEIFCYITNICIVYNITNRIIKNKRRSILCAMAFMAVFFNFFTFVTGNLTDSYSVTFQLISIALIVDYYLFKTDIEHPPLYMYIHGCMASICGLMRPTNAGMWIPFGILLALRLFTNGKVKNFFINFIALICGIITVFIPPTVYAVKNQCLEDMWFGTITANLRYAGNAASTHALLNFLKGFIFDPSFIVIILVFISMIVLFKHCENIYFCYTLLFMFLGSLFLMNVSLRNDGQYNQLYMVFIIPSLIWIFTLTDRFAPIYLWIPFLICVTIICNLQTIKQVVKYGTYHYHYEAALDMKEIMDHDLDVKPEDQLIFVTGLQNLYYNVTDRLPHMKYFTLYGYGLHYDVFKEPTNMQVTSICDLENDYIIVNYQDDGSIYGISEIDEQIEDCLSEYYENVYETTEGINTVLFHKLK